MASSWGESKRLTCDVCGLRYDDMRTGMTFKEVRNLIITIGHCTKVGHVKNGRRRGVLGYWHELKVSYWQQHVGMCEAGQRELLDEQQARRTA